MTPYYPVMLDLQDKSCVVVGGGDVAARKVLGLLDRGARVSVIAPSADPALADLAARGAIRLLERPYQEGDLRGRYVAIAATDDPNVNEAVWREAESRGILINAVDDPQHCNFVVPSVLRRGDIQIAVSTAGQSPALARTIRERLERVITPAYGEFAAMLGESREAVKAQVPDPAARARVWEALVASDILDLLENGQQDAARHLFEEILRHEVG